MIGDRAYECWVGIIREPARRLMSFEGTKELRGNDSQSRNEYFSHLTAMCSRGWLVARTSELTGGVWVDGEELPLPDHAGQGIASQVRVDLRGVANNAFPLQSNYQDR